MSEQPKLLVVDDDAATRRLTETYLRAQGFEVREAGTATDALNLLEGSDTPPDLILLDLILPDTDGFHVLEAVRKSPKLSAVPVLAVSALDDHAAVARAFAAGADDFVRKPLHWGELVARIRVQLRMRHVVQELERKESDARVLAELTQKLASSLEMREILFTVVRRIADVLGMERVSIVLVPESNEDDVGHVLATSDDAELFNLKLDLAKYPEIQEVLRTQEPLRVEDAATHPVFEHVRGEVARARIGSVTLIPISWQDRAVGVLFLRSAQPRGLLEREIRFCRIVANATAVALRNARVLQSLRERIQTKDFLESLIHASVDGIVASDMKGTIILFNKGAEAIYGYDPADVIGKKHVSELYPPGVAKEVMRMIRSPQHGGEGKLDNIRLDAVNASGERVPISLSAAIIYEDGVPVATFGIFTDLSERIRVEERLEAAQQKLAVTEKQALLAELAGTAAHELNQPLTSVMGYAELLKRKLARETSEYAAAEVIVHEAERMADIVRKIGKITKYETKAYVGHQKILDLERSADGPENRGRGGE